MFSRKAASDADRKETGGRAEARRPEINAMLNVAKPEPKAKLLSKVDSQFVVFSPEKRAALWLEDQITQAKGKVTSQVVDLTPALARILLNRNPNNRKCSDRVVDSYARDMKNGSWKFNGEPIIVSKDGLLNDGQHRCEAVIVADTHIPVFLIIGVDRDTRTTLDQGKMRSIGDFLSMEGHANSVQLGVIGSFIWQYESAGMLAAGSNNRPTKSEILAFIEAHPDIVASHGVVSRKGANAYGGITMLGFVHYVFWKKTNRMNADNFIIALIDGDNLSRGHPILYVRNRLVNERGRLRANDKAELLFRAWNAVRRGDTGKKMMITGGKLPELEV